MKVESVGPSPFTVPDQQVQMRYTSPKNVRLLFCNMYLKYVEFHDVIVE